MPLGEGSDERDPGLKVRVLKIVSADGSESVRESVYCPRKEVSMNVDTCTHCGKLRGIGLDEKDGSPMLECVPADPVDDDGARVTPISEIMSRSVVAVTREVGVGAVRTALAERSWGIVPVVDNLGHPVGLISAQDLLKRRRLVRHDLTAEDVMKPVESGLSEGASVAEAAALLAQEQVKGYPVVDHDSQVVGIVTSLDVAMWLARSEGYLVVKSRKGGIVQTPGLVSAAKALESRGTDAGATDAGSTGGDGGEPTG